MKGMRLALPNALKDLLQARPAQQAQHRAHPAPSASAELPQAHCSRRHALLSRHSVGCVGGTSQAEACC